MTQKRHGLGLKQKLLELCDAHIPTKTIQFKFQPPWFDSDTFKLCKEKDMWRAKYKISKYPEHYRKFSTYSKDLKNLIQDKIRSNLNNEDEDPVLISKRFWSHVKATSNSSRIPELRNFDQIHDK